jgi:acetamidase/formamidase
VRGPQPVVSLAWFPLRKIRQSLAARESRQLIPLMKSVRLARTVVRALLCFAAPLLSAAPLKINHHLRSTPENIVAFFAAENEPVLRIKSGEVVEIETVCMFGMSEDKPEQFFIDNGVPLDLPVVQDLIAIKKKFGENPGGRAGGAMTGPVYIEGAMPGDTLEVRVIDVKSRAAYGVNSCGPGRGAIPDLVPRPYTKVVKLDLDRNVAMFSDTIEVPLQPFQGRMGVAPVKERGKLPSAPPYRDIGGNMDNRHLGKGATVYFPVQVEGALFLTGDPHAVQGNGEAGQSALESSNTVTLQFFLRKDMPIQYVQAETATHYISMGMDVDLDRAMYFAAAETVGFLQRTKGLSFTDALALCSLAVDYEVTEVVDGTKGIHAMIPKSIFKGSQAASTYWYQPSPAVAAGKLFFHPSPIPPVVSIF